MAPGNMLLTLRAFSDIEVLPQNISNRFRNGESGGKDHMDRNSKIYVAGHRGLAGSAIVRQLNSEGYENLILRRHKELDLKRQRQVEAFFQEERPEYVFLAAAKVGGSGRTPHCRHSLYMTT